MLVDLCRSTVTGHYYAESGRMISALCGFRRERVLADWGSSVLIHAGLGYFFCTALLAIRRWIGGTQTFIPFLALNGGRMRLMKLFGFLGLVAGLSGAIASQVSAERIEIPGTE